MEPLENYRKLASEIGRRSFLNEFPHLFLLKRPITRELPVDQEWDDKFSFTTKTIELGDGDADLVDEEGPFAAEWFVLPVRKNPSAPYPDRLSVGRAKNCDLCLRFPSVSKLHAHFLAPHGYVTHVQAHSAVNGTRVDGRLLGGSETAPVRAGTRLKFGAVEVELVDSATLFAVFLAG